MAEAITSKYLIDFQRPLNTVQVVPKDRLEKVADFCLFPVNRAFGKTMVIRSLRKLELQEYTVRKITRVFVIIIFPLISPVVLVGTISKWFSRSNKIVYEMAINIFNKRPVLKLTPQNRRDVADLEDLKNEKDIRDKIKALNNAKIEADMLTKLLETGLKKLEPGQLVDVVKEKDVEHLVLNFSDKALAKFICQFIKSDDEKAFRMVVKIFTLLDAKQPGIFSPFIKKRLKAEQMATLWNLLFEQENLKAIGKEKVVAFIHTFGDDTLADVLKVSDDFIEGTSLLDWDTKSIKAFIDAYQTIDKAIPESFFIGEGIGKKLVEIVENEPKKSFKAVFQNVMGVIQQSGLDNEEKKALFETMVEPLSEKDISDILSDLKSSSCRSHLTAMLTGSPYEETGPKFEKVFAIFSSLYKALPEIASCGNAELLKAIRKKTKSIAKQASLEKLFEFIKAFPKLPFCDTLMKDSERLKLFISELKEEQLIHVMSESSQFTDPKKRKSFYKELEKVDKFSSIFCHCERSKISFLLGDVDREQLKKVVSFAAAMPDDCNEFSIKDDFIIFCMQRWTKLVWERFLNSNQKSLKTFGVGEKDIILTQHEKFKEIIDILREVKDRQRGIQTLTWMVAGIYKGTDLFIKSLNRSEQDLLKVIYPNAIKQVEFLFSAFDGATKTQLKDYLKVYYHKHVNRKDITLSLFDCSLYFGHYCVQNDCGKVLEVVDNTLPQNTPTVYKLVRKEYQDNIITHLMKGTENCSSDAREKGRTLIPFIDQNIANGFKEIRAYLNT
jgi:ribosomal protein L12E/L44/L45/RPP1/RPP2